MSLVPAARLRMASRTKAEGIAIKGLLAHAWVSVVRSRLREFAVSSRRLPVRNTFDFSFSLERGLL